MTKAKAKMIAAKIHDELHRMQIFWAELYTYPSMHLPQSGPPESKMVH